MKAQKKYGHFKLAVEWHGTWKQCQTVCALRICQFVRLALRTDSKPCWLYLCCWRCRSQSPALHLMLWLCWRPAQRRGSVEGSAPRAPVFVLEEQIKPCGSHGFPRLRVFPAKQQAYRHHAEDTDSLRDPWPATRPPLRRSHRTLLHCSYPAVPRSPLNWQPATKKGTIYPHLYKLGSWSSHADLAHHNLWTLITISSINHFHQHYPKNMEPCPNE